MTKFALYSLALGWLTMPAASAFAEAPAPVRLPTPLPHLTMQYQPSIVSSCDAHGKVCVAEPKPTTKVVYGCVTKDVCRPGVSLCGWFGDKDCESGACGKVYVRNVLVKKVVPGPVGMTCVARDAMPSVPATIVEPLKVAPTPVKNP